jgi:hypothetical protein
MGDRQADPIGCSSRSVSELSTSSIPVCYALLTKLARINASVARSLRDAFGELHLINLRLHIEYSKNSLVEAKSMQKGIKERELEQISENMNNLSVAPAAKRRLSRALPENFS